MPLSVRELDGRGTRADADRGDGVTHSLCSAPHGRREVKRPEIKNRAEERRGEAGFYDGFIDPLFGVRRRRRD